MNAIKFIRQHGVEKAGEVVEGAPKNAQRYSDGMYFKQGEWTWFWSPTVSKWLQYEKHIYSTCSFDFAVDLSDLKRLVESLDLVEKFGDLEAAKAYVPDGYKSERLKQAIADYEAIGGEHV